MTSPRKLLAMWLMLYFCRAAHADDRWRRLEFNSCELDKGPADFIKSLLGVFGPADIQDVTEDGIVVETIVTFPKSKEPAGHWYRGKERCERALVVRDAEAKLRKRDLDTALKRYDSHDSVSCSLEASGNSIDRPRADTEAVGLDRVMYENQLEGLVTEHRTWKDATRRLSARVGVSIKDDGGTENVRILKSSGDQPFDEAAVKAVRVASPLPAPPEKYRDIFRNYRFDVSCKPDSGKVE